MPRVNPTVEFVSLIPEAELCTGPAPPGLRGAPFWRMPPPPPCCGARHLSLRRPEPQQLPRHSRSLVERHSERRRVSESLWTALVLCLPFLLNGRAGGKEKGRLTPEGRMQPGMGTAPSSALRTGPVTPRVPWRLKAASTTPKHKAAGMKRGDSHSMPALAFTIHN